MNQRLNVFANDMEYYTWETKTRQTLAEMFKPICTEIDVDRERMAEIDIHQQQAAHRLAVLEYTIGLQRKKKPLAFVEIEDILADVKA